MTLKKYFKNSFAKKVTKKIQKREKLHILKEIIMKSTENDVFKEDCPKNEILYEHQEINLKDNEIINPKIYKDEENIKTAISEKNGIITNVQTCFKAKNYIENRLFDNQAYSNIVPPDEKPAVDKEIIYMSMENQHNTKKLVKDQAVNNKNSCKLKNEYKMLEIPNFSNLEKKSMEKYESDKNLMSPDKNYSPTKKYTIDDQENPNLIKNTHQNNLEKELLSERRTKIESLKEVPLLPCPIYTKLYLPEILKKMIKLYTSLLTVYRFNKDKGLNTVFIKSLKSIEDMCNFKVTQSLLEQLFYIASDCFLFKKVSIQHYSKYVDSFTFECLKDKNYFNQKIYEYFRNSFKNNEIPRKSLFENLKDKNSISGSKDLKDNNFISESKDLKDNNSIHESKDLKDKIKNIILQKPDLSENKNLPDNTFLDKSLSQKTKDILERIQEKERKRRESFIKQCSDEDLIKETKYKIDTYFSTTNKKSIPVEELITVLSIFKGYSVILKLCSKFNDIYFIKEIQGIEYLIRKI